MTARLAYAQAVGVEAVTDRLMLEDRWGAGQEGIATADSFRITAGGGATPMSVTVGPGRAVVRSDVPFNGSYYVADDETRVLTVGAAAAAGSGQYRRDAVVARVRDASLVAADGDNSFSVQIIQGSNTASSEPPLPAIPDRTVLLADIVVNPGATGPSKITDRRAMAKPRTFSYQSTIVQGTTVVVSQTTWVNVNGFYLPSWPDWARTGGHLCFQKISSTARVLQAGDVALRSIFGDALGDAKASGVSVPQKLYSPGTFPFIAAGEFTTPVLSTPFSTLQVQRLGASTSALTFETQLSVTTHEIHVVETPS